MTRQRLLNRRRTENIKATIGGHNIYVRLSRFQDGRIAECFVKVNKVGTAIHSLMDALAITISIALQHGAPVKTITSALKGIEFEPNGPVVGNDRVPKATSLVDYLARVLETENGEVME